MGSRNADLFALTRQLIDIESTTPNESEVGDFLCDELRRRGFDARKMPVEGRRNNVLDLAPASTSGARLLDAHGYRAAVHSFL